MRKEQIRGLSAVEADEVETKLIESIGISRSNGTTLEEDN